MAKELNVTTRNRVIITYKELENIVENKSKDVEDFTKMKMFSKFTEANLKSTSRSKRPDKPLYIPKKHSTPIDPIPNVCEDNPMTTSDYGQDSKSSVKSEGRKIPVSCKSKTDIEESSHVRESLQKSSRSNQPHRQVRHSSSAEIVNTDSPSLPKDDARISVESVEFVNSKISADISRKSENKTLNKPRVKETSPLQNEGKASSCTSIDVSKSVSNSRERIGQNQGKLRTKGRRRPTRHNESESSCSSEKSSTRSVSTKVANSGNETALMAATNLKSRSTLMPHLHKNVEHSENKKDDRDKERETAQSKKIPYKPEILDWSAEVESSEIDENESESISSETKVNPVNKTVKSSRDKKYGGGASSSKLSSCPKSVKKSINLSENTGKASGIIRVDLPKASETLYENSSSSYFHKSPSNEREISGKHLFDPDHPERPLCVVPPASHLTNERKFYAFPPASQGMPRPRVPYGSMGGPPNHPYMVPMAFGRMISPVDPHFAFGGPRPFFNNMSQGNPVEYHSPYNLNATEKNIRECMMLETQLNILLSPPFQEMDLKALGQCRWKIQLRYETTILSDMEFCTKHNVEQAMWKAAFYQVIENFRRQMLEDPNVTERIRQAMINIIDEGSVFYENLLEKLQETFGFHLRDFLDSNAIRPTSLSRSVKLALLSAQKVTICLGDLVRYREQATDGCNYGKARSWYLKAQQLAPKNGRPYNQLAILAVYARRKLDAVYYYMRSLSASNPFQSAKEGLINIFDDARKKYEKSRDSNSDNDAARQKQKHEPKKRVKRGVIEVWYTPDGQVVNHGATADDEESSNSENNDDHTISNMRPIDLSKTFSLSFLHVHGKLYSRVGMETITETAVKMFREFRHLLRLHPPALNSQRLVQIMTINVFAIDNAGLKGTEVMAEPHCQTVIQGKALEVGVEMFRLIVARCDELLQENVDDTSLNFDEELSNLLPAIKIWCDWLLCHPSIWNPLPSLTDYDDLRTENKDVWTHLASLLNILKRWDTVEPFITSGRLHDDCEPVILPEDTSLAGFVPLLALPQETVFVRAPMDKEYAINLFRIKRILYCGEFLCGIRPAVLDYSVETQSYVPITNDPVQPKTRVQEMVMENDSTESVVDSVEEPSEDWDTDDPLDANTNSTCYNLRNRKQQLEKVKAHQEQQQRQIQALLKEVSESRDVRFEVHPKWLIPDTNCFIDHLADIQKLVLTCKFHLVVPLVVINELEGLARNLRNFSNVNSHSYKVGQEAQNALKCLGEWTSRRNIYVRAITAKGSLLDSIAFRSETENCDKSSTNDDIILSCCMHLCDEEASKSKCSVQQKRKDKDNVIRICRDVVLLTDDRNLRVKAHAQEMPVKTIPRFMCLMNLNESVKQKIAN